MEQKFFSAFFSFHPLIYKGERGKRALFPFPSRDSSVGEFVAGLHFPFSFTACCTVFLSSFFGRKWVIAAREKKGKLESSRGDTCAKEIDVFFLRDRKSGELRKK